MNDARTAQIVTEVMKKMAQQPWFIALSPKQRHEALVSAVTKVLTAS